MAQMGIYRYFENRKDDGSGDDAISWYRRSAEFAEGHTLGAAYANIAEVRDEQGRHDPADDDGAVHWYRQAVEAGHTEAQGRLTEILGE